MSDKPNSYWEYVDSSKYVLVPREVMNQIHERLVELADLTEYMTQKQRRRKIGDVAAMTGGYATRPTDLFSHRDCDLAAFITERQYYRKVALDREGEDILLMPEATDYEVLDEPELTTIYCIDHERDLDNPGVALEWS